MTTSLDGCVKKGGYMKRKWIMGLSALTFVFTMLVLSVGSVTAENVQQAPVRQDDMYVGREFNEMYDKLFEDFNRELGVVGDTGLWWDSVDGTGTYFSSYHLKADYSTSAGTTLDAPIYKVGSPTNAQGEFENLVIEMTGLNGASIDDLVLAFRLNDNYADIYVDFDELLDPDLQPLPEFDGTPQQYVISVTNSLDGKNFELIPGKTGDPTVAAGSAIQGLHFMSKTSGGSGTLELTKIYWTSEANPVFAADDSNYALLDDFMRENIFEGADNIWWRGSDSTFKIIGNHLVLDSSEMVTPSCELDVTAGGVCVDVTNATVFDNFDRTVLDPGTDNHYWYDAGNASVPDNALVLDATGMVHAYYKSAAKPSVNNMDAPLPYLVLKMKADAGTDLGSFRMQTIVGSTSSAERFFNAGNLVGPDGVAIQEVTTEWQYFVIDLAQSGLDLAHEGLTLTFGDWGAGVLHIDEILYADEKSLDAFVQPAIYRSAGYDNSNADGTYDNVVLRIRGELGTEDVMVAPFYVIDGVDTLGTPVALSTLLGPDGLAVPALTTDFQGLVVNFSENGWDNNVNGFKFMTPEGQQSNVYIDQVFFTNMEYDASLLDLTFPVLDAADIKVFDHFERDDVGATLDYDPANPDAIASDMDFIIAYAGLERMSMEDGQLVFDTTVNTNYMQYTVGSMARSNDGAYQYVVFKLKGSDGALLSNFRFQTIDTGGARSDAIWANGEMKSGAGLNTVTAFDDDSYPYVDEDGYVYLIVDLVESGFSADVSGFDLFYSGGGKLYIDAIFFANATSAEVDVENRMVFDDFDRAAVNTDNPTEVAKYWYDTGSTSIVDGAMVMNASDNGDETFAHAWYRTAGYPNNMDNALPYMLITMKGSAGTTLESFRMHTIVGSNTSDDKFFNAGNLVGPDGQPIPALTEEYQTFVIDLQLSGLDVAHEGYGLIFGDWAGGELSISEVAYAGNVPVLPAVQTAIDGYSYPTPLTCDEGYTLIDGECIEDEDEEPITCDTDQTLVDGQCIDNVPDPDPDPDPEPEPEPEPEDSGCFGAFGLQNLAVISGVAILGVMGLAVLRKRH
jgi:hypothetical protein